LNDVKGGSKMKLPRRNFLHLAAGAAALPVVSRAARAQAYPARPVRIIVPFAPAGTTDITARLIGQWLSEQLGQQFFVENRPGAGTNIGIEAVVRARPDGYTLLMTDPSPTATATLYDKLSFNFINDIAPVAGVLRSPLVIVINPYLRGQSPNLLHLPRAIRARSAWARPAPDRHSM
jgi:tripartite-type tricarboxylate transporter receptor subunit TctC